MARSLLILVVLSYIALGATGQQWIKNLPNAKSQEELTLYDYQKAFNDYWEPYNVKKGYYTNPKGEKVKAKGWKKFKRWEWDLEPQVNPQTGKLPEKSATDIYQSWLRQHQVSTSKSSNWTSLGPSSSAGGYAGVGRINCISFHPSDNNTYWIGAPSGGLWMTTDNGSSWTCMTDDNDVLGVSDIVIPSDYATSNTIYIATGDRDAWDNRSVGVLKSTDGGNTWNTTDLSFTLSQGDMVTRLLLNPNDDQTIIAATTNGVYKTADGGATWSNQLTSTSFIDMEYKPGDYTTLYGSNKNGDIYVSSDGGSIWNTNLNSSGTRTELAVSPNETTWVYAIMSNTDNGLYGIYKSTNSGSSFTQVFDGTVTGNNLLGWDNGGDNGGQGWYDLSIAASPTDANTVLVGGVNTWRSTDGGTNWSLVNHWIGNYSAQEVHADKHMLKYRSNGDLFECNDGGVYISTSDGASGSYVDKTNGMVISQMYRLGTAATDPDETITGLQDNGTKLRTSTGWNDVKGGDGMECIIDFTDVNVQYGTYVRGQISRTTDHWGSSTAIEPSGAGNGAWVTPYIMDPNDNQTLYAGYANVWKTTNRGDSWTEISSMNSSDKLRSIAIAPSNSQVLYTADLYNIWKTTDGGSSWTDISSGLPGNQITYIAVKHNDPNTLWVTLGGYDSNGIYKSTDGGSSWTNITGSLPQLPVYTVVQNKLETTEDHLYVGTEVGVYFKQGTANWQLYSTNLPNVKIDELEIYYDETTVENSRLRTATYGRGLWESPIVLSGSYPPSLSTDNAANITQTSATLNATINNNNGETITETGFVYATTPSPEIGGTGVTQITTNPVVTSGSFSEDISGLSAATTYYVKAYAINANGTGYGNEINFSTDCGIITTLPYTQDFSTGGLPNCWQNVDNEGGGQVWLFNNPNNTTFNSSSSGNGFAILDSDYYGSGNTQDADLVSPEFDFSSMQTVNLAFEYYYRDYEAETATLSYSTDNGATWTSIQSWSGTTTANPEIFDQDLTTEVAGQSGVRFKWNYTGTWGYYWAIDDIEITGTLGTTNTLTFVVEDDTDNHPVTGATIDINSQALTTNSTGEATIDLVDGTYSYTVNSNGYFENTGNVTISGSNVTETVLLTPYDSITFTATPTDVTCNGGTDGSISFSSVSGGSGTGYQYSVDGGISWQSNPSFSNLSTGDYYTKIKDDAGNVSSVETLTISEPEIITFNPVVTNESAGNDGAIDFTELTGGNGGYEYSIDGGLSWQSNPTFNNLEADTYFALVKDAQGCLSDQTTVTINITAYTLTLNIVDANDSHTLDGATIEINSSTLTSDINGQATIDLVYGDYNYTVSKSGYQQTTGTVTMNGTNQSITVQLTPSEPISFDVATTDVTCFGGSDGSIDITNTSGGSGSGYQYSIDSGLTWQSTTSFNNLSAGTYNVFVEDNLGELSDLTQVTLTEPDSLTFVTNTTNVSTQGGSDGSIEFTNTTGGNGVYEYSIDNGSTWSANTLFSNLEAGYYYALTKDGNNCMSETSVILITEPGQEEYTVTFTVTDASDSHLINDATIFINSTTIITDINGTATINLLNGDYSYTVSKNGYQDYANSISVAGQNENVPVSLTPNTSITFNTNITDVTCYGATNGEIEIVNVTGGSGTGYQYSIDGGTTWQASNLFTALPAGNYNARVKDDIGDMSSTSSITINEPEQVNFSINSTDVSSAGAEDGLIDFVNVTGGTGTYMYSIDNGTNWQSNATFSNLAMGTYNTVVKDDNSCIADAQTVTIEISSNDEYTASFTVKDADNNDPLNGASVDINNETVYTNSSGEVSVSLPNGDYSYVVSLSGYEQKSSSLSINNSNISVIVSLNPIVDVTFTPVLSHVTCNGENDGEIQFVDVSGGSGSNYQYTIDGGSNWESSAIFSNLTPSAYQLQVKDGNGQLSSTTNAQISEPDPISYNTNATDVSTAGGNDGSISFINVSGGISPYTYSIDNGNSWESTSTISNLEAGAYTTMVKDANNCISQSQLVTIEEPGEQNYTVTFTVYENTHPVENASIQIDDNTLNTNISGQAFIQLSDGNYPYIASYNGYNNLDGTVVVNGSDITEQIHFTGLNDILEGRGKIYPNPSTGIINIEWPGNCTLTITNAIGKTIETLKIENEGTADLSSAPEGIYMLLIRSDKETISKRIIIAR